MTGVLANPPGSGANDVSGDVSLTFDFASGTLTAGQLFTNIITTPPVANISIPVFGGSIVANSFSVAGIRSQYAVDTNLSPVYFSPTPKQKY